MITYNVEVTEGQSPRYVEADAIGYEADWLVFYRRPPQGGATEYWRVALRFVVSVETKGGK